MFTCILTSIDLFIVFASCFLLFCGLSASAAFSDPNKFPIINTNRVNTRIDTFFHSMFALRVACPNNKMSSDFLNYSLKISSLFEDLKGKELVLDERVIYNIMIYPRLGCFDFCRSLLN